MISWLKQEVQRLKSLRLKELESQLEKKRQLTNSIANLQNKVGKDAKALYLQSHAQMCPKQGRWCLCAKLN